MSIEFLQELLEQQEREINVLNRTIEDAVSRMEQLEEQKTETLELMWKKRQELDQTLITCHKCGRWEGTLECPRCHDKHCAEECNRYGYCRICIKRICNPL